MHRRDEEPEPDDDAIRIIEALSQLIQTHGPEFGLTECDYMQPYTHYNKTEAVLAFRFGDDSYTISSESIDIA